MKTEEGKRAKKLCKKIENLIGALNEEIRAIEKKQYEYVRDTHFSKKSEKDSIKYLEKLEDILGEYECCACRLQDTIENIEECKL